MGVRLFRTLHRRLTQMKGQAQVPCGGMEGRFYVASRGEYKHVCGGLFERAVIERFLSLLEPTDVIYEVGATSVVGRFFLPSMWIRGRCMCSRRTITTPRATALTWP